MILPDVPTIFTYFPMILPMFHDEGPITAALKRNMPSKVVGT
jgi:hypothetical protein